MFYSAVDISRLMAEAACFEKTQQMPKLATYFNGASDLACVLLGD